MVQCINFKTGEVIWSWNEIEGNTVASPSFNKNVVVVGSSKPDNTIALSIVENEKR